MNVGYPTSSYTIHLVHITPLVLRLLVTRWGRINLNKTFPSLLLLVFPYTVCPAAVNSTSSRLPLLFELPGGFSFSAHSLARHLHAYWNAIKVRKSPTQGIYFFLLKNGIYCTCTDLDPEDDKPFMGLSFEAGTYAQHTPPQCHHGRHQSTGRL